MNDTDTGRDTDRGEPTGRDDDRVEPVDTVETVEVGHDADEVADDDVVSDPAKDDRLGAEWADEGGAVPEGPATSTREAEERTDDEEEYGEAGLPQITLDPPD